WLTFADTKAADDGATFRVVVTNDLGSATSAPAVLKLNPLPAGPAITTNPADQVVTAGQPVTFTAGASAAGTLTYQWRKNGVNIAGAAASSMSIPAAISADSGASFTLVVTNS